MGRLKGTGKTGGRKAGTPNKISSELKVWVKDLIDENRATFEKDLKELEPKDRLMIIEKLMTYILPKQQAISAELQVQTEYAELEKLLDKAPDKVVDALLERMNKITNNEDEDR